jgi:hypothetical protein
MTYAESEQARCRAIYEAAVTSWHRARSEGHLVEETDSHERYAGVRWKATGPEGRAALSAFQVAKSNLDHAAERVRREAGDESCHVCPKKHALGRMADFISELAETKSTEPDRRLPPEREEPEMPF